MPSHASRIRISPLRAAAVLFVLVLATTYVSGGLMAKYASTDAGAGAARVAAFSFVLTDGTDSVTSHVVDLSAIEKPGDSASYTFTVASKSEVSVTYGLRVAYNGSLPLECAIRPAGTGTPVLTTTVTGLSTAISEGNMPYTTTMPTADWVSKPPNTPTADTYTLTVTWPSSQRDLAYTNDVVGELTLYAIATQVD